MSNKALTLWRESVTQYCAAHNLKYTIFKKGTAHHSAVKKIYENKMKGNNSCKVCSKKVCKCDK